LPWHINPQHPTLASLPGPHPHHQMPLETEASRLMASSSALDPLPPISELLPDLILKPLWQSPHGDNARGGMGCSVPFPASLSGNHTGGGSHSRHSFLAGAGSYSASPYEITSAMTVGPSTSQGTNQLRRSARTERGSRKPAHSFYPVQDNDSDPDYPSPHSPHASPIVSYSIAPSSHHNSPPSDSIRLVTKGPPKQRPCPYDGCSRSFNYADKLAAHIRTHTGERPFGCEILSFSLKDHMVTHGIGKSRRK
jgi:hypothetical protein